ncbi:MAG: SDR family NAD(P)-dependent oxidoreductase [Psychromonas sp.]
MKILIIGGSGGIGAALVQLFLTSHPEAIIYSTYRSNKPDIDNSRIHWFKVDLSSEQEIRSLAERIPELTLLVNAVGILHQPDNQPEKSIKEFNGDFFNHNMTSNVMPTIYLAKHFAVHLKSKKNSHFVTISARIGSIEDNKIGGWISYRCSKAALNMALKTISVEWKYKLPNCCVFAFHPGTTDTNLSKQFQRNVPANKLFTPEYVAHCLAELISKKTATDSGQFFSYDGSKIPW